MAGELTVVTRYQSAGVNARPICCADAVDAANSITSTAIERRIRHS
jgi:hypothetical protein